MNFDEGDQKYSAKFIKEFPNKTIRSSEFKKTKLKLTIFTMLSLF